jgi:DNA-binding NarL/FixJ family response regulator
MSAIEDINTLVMHDDPVLEAGLVAILREAPGLRLVSRFLFSDLAGSGGRASFCPTGEGMEVQLVIADYRRGMAWLKQDRAGESHPPARVIILTALEGERDIRAALEAGAAGLLGQGCPVDEVRQAAITVARGARHLSPTIAHQLADSFVHDALTDREIGVLTLIAAGMCNKTIARELRISVATVKSHVSSILEKLQVTSRTQAVSKAGERRLIAPPGQTRSITTAMPWPTPMHIAQSA